MEHSFDIEIAAEYGIECAILLKHLYFWIKKNEANDENFFDGRYWTYNSVKAFSVLFPYMTERKVRYTLEKMEERGLIVVGNYNKSQYDRTKWYALTDLAYSILQKENFHLSKTSNGKDANGEPIPDINTYINTDNTLDSKESNCRTEARRCVEAWNSLSEYGIKTISRLSSSSQRYQRLSARIKEYGLPSVLSAIEKVKGSSFLQGKSSGKKAWVITFDWFVLPNNFPKVLDGNYDDRPDNQKSDVEQGNQKWKPASKLAADEWQ